jgi:hypothetical protein
MRLPILVALVSVLLVRPAAAGSQRCGDDVDGVAVPCACGDVLVGSRTLGDADPVTRDACPGSGLVVNVPGGGAATLDLHGYTIRGDGRGIGIDVGHGALTLVGPGGVEGFATGIVSPRGGLVRATGVDASGNLRDGFLVAGDGWEILDCEASANGRDGFSLRGARFRIDGSRAHHNRRYGFRIAGVQAAVGDQLGNEASGNGRGGLFVSGRDVDVNRPFAAVNEGPGVKARIRRGRVRGAVANRNKGDGVVAAGDQLSVSDTDADANGGTGVRARGRRVRDGGGNRARGNGRHGGRRGPECLVGTECR